MMYVTRLTAAEKQVMTEAFFAYEAQQQRVIRRVDNGPALAEAKWRKFVARQLREQIAEG